MKNNTKIIEGIFDGLMRKYKKNVPDVNKILNAMIEKGIIKNTNEIENDHVAFRTMGVKNLGIKSFEKIFLHHGYKAMDKMYFEGKKLNAIWYAPPKDHLPRIFISELIVTAFPEEIQKLIYSYTDEVKSDPVDKLNLNNVDEVDNFLHSPLWRTPTYSDYETLLNKTEYAAWVIYNRYYLNHYTISVHNLKKGYNTLEEFNNFLEDIGIKLNDSGGKIKISKDQLLLQSSTVAAMIEAKFADNISKKIAGSYVEFAERRVKPEFRNLKAEEIKRVHRRDAFEEGNADKIFESTFTTQTNKK